MKKLLIVSLSLLVLLFSGCTGTTDNNVGDDIMKGTNDVIEGTENAIDDAGNAIEDMMDGKDATQNTQNGADMKNGTYGTMDSATTNQ